MPVQPKSKLLGWVPLALGAWLVVFGTYEVVERTLLVGASSDLLRTLHIVRGTGTSFLLAGLVAWYLLRHHLPGLPESRFLGGLRTIVAVSEAKELAEQTRWIIRLRWMAVVGVTVMTVTCRFGFGVISGFSALALFLIVGVMIGYNILFSLAPPKELTGIRVAFAQVFLDLAALTLMLYFAGGIQNPFFLFYIFHVVIAGILLRRTETSIVTAGACLFFCGMVLSAETHLIPNYPLNLEMAGWMKIPQVHRWPFVAGILTAFAITLWSTAYFTTTIVEKLRRRGKEILEAGEILSQERAKTEDIVRSVGAALVILDARRDIVWANDLAREWFGTDLQGTACRLGLWKQSSECESCPIPEVMDGRRATYERSVALHGKQKFFLVSCSPVRSAGGKVEQILALIQDITPMKEIQIQLVQAGKMVAVGQLAAGIAHEINNPLAIVASSAELLHELLPTGEAAQRHLKKIEDNVYRCKGITQNLLAFARRDDEGFEEVEPTRLLDDTLLLVEGSARARDRQIQRFFAHDLAIRSRPRLIQQIVLNLVLNALDATPAGGTVVVSVEGKDGGVEIAVSDTGPGIAPEHLGRIFEPFFTTKPAGKGTGLGLYLCHQFAEALGGKISVHSPPGGGATFRLWLPAEGGTTP